MSCEIIVWLSITLYYTTYKACLDWEEKEGEWKGVEYNWLKIG